MPSDHVRPCPPLSATPADMSVRPPSLKRGDTDTRHRTEHIQKALNTAHHNHTPLTLHTPDGWTTGHVLHTTDELVVLLDKERRTLIATNAIQSTR